MRRAIVLLACLALSLAACDAGGDDEPAPQPTVTVTVTETTTPGTPTASPTSSPTASPQAGATCQSLSSGAGAAIAFIVVESPEPGAAFSSGDQVTGCGNTFEAGYRWELLDGQQQVLADGFGTMTCGNGCVGTFSFAPTFSVSTQQMGVLRVFESSAQDGSDIHVNSIPVLLGP